MDGLKIYFLGGKVLFKLAREDMNRREEMIIIYKISTRPAQVENAKVRELKV